GRFRAPGSSAPKTRSRRWRATSDSGGSSLGSPAMDAAPDTSAGSRLADLELVVERCETRHLEADAGAFGRRVTTEIVLHGEGEEGVGEGGGGARSETAEALRRLQL